MVFLFSLEALTSLRIHRTTSSPPYTEIITASRSGHRDISTLNLCFTSMKPPNFNQISGTSCIHWCLRPKSYTPSKNGQTRCLKKKKVYLNQLKKCKKKASSQKISGRLASAGSRLKLEPSLNYTNSWRSSRHIGHLPSALWGSTLKINWKKKHLPTLLETNSEFTPQKFTMDGWKTILSFWESRLFQVLC